ncbi:MAG: phage holin family protein [Candidatus Krumholzibacteriia bacterium]
MKRLVVRWLLSGVAIAIVAWMLPGIRVGSGPQGVWTVLVGAAFLGLANSVVKPVLMLLSCPLILLTLGLFLFVINAWTLMIASGLARAAGFPFRVEGWGTAIVGSILITIVNWLLSLFVQTSKEEEETS